jgi:hypothetical protein
MEELENFYYNPKTGYTNLATLYQKQKEGGLNYKYKDVRQWYNDQKVNQIYKKPPKIRTYNRIRSHWNQTGEMQGDLMDLTKFSRWNKGYKFLFNVIDIYSRRAWIFPIKRKIPKEIIPFIPVIFNSIPKNHYKSISFDMGSEFLGGMDDMLKKNNIKKFLVDPHSINAKNKQALIERLNYSVWLKLKKYMADKGSVKYIDVLDDLLYNYNHSKHSTIKKKPQDVFDGKEYPHDLGLNLSSKGNEQFSVGDHVRHKLKRRTFDKKGFTPTFSLTVYKIQSISNNKYNISNGKSYYSEELVKAKESEDMIDIKRKHDVVNKEDKIRKESKREVTKHDLAENVVTAGD